MPGEVFNRGWLDGNMTRAYPFAPWTPRTDVTGAFRIPDDLLVELYFPVGPGVAVDPGAFFVKTLAAYATGIVLTLGYADGSAAGVAAGSATLAIEPDRLFIPAALPGSGDFAGSIGKLTVGSFRGLEDQPSGLFHFRPEATQLDLDCVRPQLGGVRGVVVDDVRLDGLVRLSLGRNIRLSAPSGDELRIDAVSGEGLVEDGGCAGAAPDSPPIATINGIPAVGGAFAIAGDDDITVTADETGLRLSNPGVTPCCGCPEIDELREAVDYIMEQLRATRSFQSRLDAQVTRMNSVVIASRVGDRGCVSCE